MSKQRTEALLFNIDAMLAELCALKAERDELRGALAQCVRRLDALNTGGPDEPDPTVVKARAVLAKTHGLMAKKASANSCARFPN